MNDNSDLRIVWWPFVIIPLLLLVLFALFQWRTIEHNIAYQAQQTINKLSNASDPQWAVAETFNRGRDLIITGLAPNQKAQTALKQNLLATQGVRTVTFAEGLAKTLTPPELNISWVDGKVLISGTLKNQTNINSIIDEAKQTYGSERVINQLQISDSVDSTIPLLNILSSFAELQNGAQVTISDKLKLVGKVASADIKSSITNSISALYVGEIDNQLTVASAPISKEEACDSRLDKILANTNIVFASGQANIAPESHQLLNNIGKIARDCAGLRYEIAGHTDSIGSPADNMILSQQRAQAVLDYLIKLDGLASEQFSVRGYGSSQPVADNNSVAGRLQNRRIEFNLTN